MDITVNNRQNTLFDKLKWAVVALLVGVAVVGNLYFEARYAAPVRVAGVIVLCVLAGFLAVTTPSGARAFEFFKAARLEMRKVVWPTRQETVQTTIIVLAIVLITALVMLAFDSLFHYVISVLILK